MSDPETIGRYCCPNCGAWFSEPNEVTPEAAAEIARLTAENQRLREEIGDLCEYNGNWAAENDRMRPVVEAAVSVSKSFSDVPDPGCCDQCDLVLAVRAYNRALDAHRNHPVNVPESGTLEEQIRVPESGTVVPKSGTVAICPTCGDCGYTVTDDPRVDWDCPTCRLDGES